MFFRHSTDKLLYPLLFGVVLVLLTYRPAYRLRNDMPHDFYAASEPCGPKRPLEQKIACAYWDSAQMNIQWKYPHGHALPDDAPNEFSINAPALGPQASSPVIREMYWHHLQHVWNLPETWKQQYEWNWAWASDPVTSIGEWLRKTVNKWFTLPS